MKNKLYTTILSGKNKGRKIILPSLKTTRSTKSIIKESYFNTIQFEIIGKNFFEVFAGSGSIGLEAFSRGAKKIYFIEKDFSAFEILKLNIENMKCDNCMAIQADSFKEFSKIIKNIEEKTYFYFDPPFEIREGMNEIYNKTFALINNIPLNICDLITIEHMSNIKMPNEIGIFQKQKSKKFGKTTLSYYK